MYVHTSPWGHAARVIVLKDSEQGPSSLNNEQKNKK